MTVLQKINKDIQKLRGETTSKYDAYLAFQSTDFQEDELGDVSLETCEDYHNSLSILVNETHSLAEQFVQSSNVYAENLNRILIDVKQGNLASLSDSVKEILSREDLAIIEASDALKKEIGARNSNTIPICVENLCNVVLTKTSAAARAAADGDARAAADGDARAAADGDARAAAAAAARADAARRAAAAAIDAARIIVRAVADADDAARAAADADDAARAADAAAADNPKDNTAAAAARAAAAAAAAAHLQVIQLQSIVKNSYRDLDQEISTLKSISGAPFQTMECAKNLQEHLLKPLEKNTVENFLQTPAVKEIQNLASQNEIQSKIDSISIEIEAAKNNKKTTESKIKKTEDKESSHKSSPWLMFGAMALGATAIVALGFVGVASFGTVPAALLLTGAVLAAGKAAYNHLEANNFNFSNLFKSNLFKNMAGLTTATLGTVATIAALATAATAATIGTGGIALGVAGVCATGYAAYKTYQSYKEETKKIEDEKTTAAKSEQDKITKSQTKIEQLEKNRETLEVKKQQLMTNPLLTLSDLEAESKAGRDRNDSASLGERTRREGVGSWTAAALSRGGHAGGERISLGGGGGRR